MTAGDQNQQLDLAAEIDAALGRLTVCGWTRTQIARTLGVDRRSLYGWAHGSIRPTDAHLAALAALAETATKPLWAPAARALAEGRLRPLGRAATVRAPEAGEMDRAAAGPGRRQRDWAEAARVLRQLLTITQAEALSGYPLEGVPLGAALKAGVEACERVEQLESARSSLHDPNDENNTRDLLERLPWRLGVLDKDLLEDPGGICENAILIAGWYIHDCDQFLRDRGDLALFTADVLELLETRAYETRTVQGVTARWCIACDVPAGEDDCAIGKALAVKTDTLAAGRAMREELERLRRIHKAANDFYRAFAASPTIEGCGTAIRHLIACLVTRDGAYDQATQDTAGRP